MQAKTDIILDSAMTVLQKHLTIEMDFKLNHHCNVRLQFKTQTEKRNFIPLSVVSVRVVHPVSGRSAMLHINLRG